MLETVVTIILAPIALFAIACTIAVAVGIVKAIFKKKT